MKMTSMKRTKEDRNQTKQAVSIDNPSSEDYPYGLSVDLDHESLEKLGMDKLPRVGQKLHLHAHAHVTSVREEHRDGGKKHRHLTIQLRKMGFDDAPAPSERSLNRGAKSAMDRALAKGSGKGGYDGAGADDGDEDD